MTFNFLVGGHSATHDFAEAAGVFIQEKSSEVLGNAKAWGPRRRPSIKYHDPS